MNKGEADVCELHSVRNKHMVLEFLADGFEEIEALTPVDILRRAGIDVKTASITENRTVTGSHGIAIEADITVSEAELIYDRGVKMVILPGGMPGSKNLDESETVDRIVRRCSEDGGVLAAICAAPMILGKRGLVRGKRAVCYPGFEKYLDGAVLGGGRVEEDGNVITACGMGAALEFALTLLKRLKGEEEALKIASSVLEK